VQAAIGWHWVISGLSFAGTEAGVYTQTLSGFVGELMSPLLLILILLLLFGGGGGYYAYGPGGGFGIGGLVLIVLVVLAVTGRL
jgi:hypothetical protein